MICKPSINRKWNKMLWCFRLITNIKLLQILYSKDTEAHTQKEFYLWKLIHQCQISVKLKLDYPPKEWTLSKWILKFEILRFRSTSIWVSVCRNPLHSGVINSAHIKATNFAMRNPMLASTTSWENSFAAR